MKSSNKFWSKIKLEHIIFALILILGLVVRFYNIQGRELWESDEAAYGNSARGVILITKWLAENFQEIISGDESLSSVVKYMHQRGAFWSPGVKPGWVIQLATLYLLFGVHDFLGIFLSASWGTLIVIWVYLIAIRIGDNPSVGVASALFAAISGGMLVYSRSALSLTPVTFLSLFTIWLYLDPNREYAKRVFLCGTILGYAFTVHQSIFLVVGIFGIIEIISSISKRISINQLLLRLSIFGIGVSIIPVIAELISRIAIIAAGPGETTPSFFQQQFIKVSMVSDMWYPTIREWFVFPRVWWDLDGPLFVIGLVVGIIYSFGSYKKWKNWNIELLVLLMTLVPVLYWSINSGAEASTKGIQVSYPFLCILAGRGIGFIASHFQRYKWLSEVKFLPGFVFGFVFVFHSIWQISTLIPFLEIRGGYQNFVHEVAKFLEENEGKLTSKGACSMWNHWAFYVAQDRDQLSPAAVGAIEFSEWDDLGDYIIIDWRHPRRFSIHETDCDEEVAEFLKGQSPEISISNPLGAMPFQFWTSQGGSERFLYQAVIADPHHDDLTLYEIGHQNK